MIREVDEAIERSSRMSLEELVEWSNRPRYCKVCGEPVEWSEEHRGVWTTTYAPCKCVREKHNIQLAEQSGASEKQRQRYAFENFKARTKELYLNLSAAKRYAAAPGKNFLLLIGKPGTGKTHLALAALQRIQSRGVPTVFIPYQTMVGEIKNARVNRLDDRAKIDRYKKTGVLLIDDLYKGTVTESDRGIVNEIIDYRYSNRMPTIITTNASLATFSDIDPAISGRIFEMAGQDFFLVFNGEDYRTGGVR